jgi:hypothetical protein
MVISMVMDTNLELIKDTLLHLFTEGQVLPRCPHCAMFLGPKELNGKCSACSGRIEFSTVVWISTDNIPKA